MSNIDKDYAVFADHIKQHKHMEAVDVDQALHFQHLDRAERSVYLAAVNSALAQDQNMDPQVRSMLGNGSLKIVDTVGGSLLVAEDSGKRAYYINPETGHLTRDKGCEQIKAKDAMNWLKPGAENSSLFK